MTYYEDSQVKVKIPASFFELSRDDKNYGAVLDNLNLLKFKYEAQ